MKKINFFLLNVIGIALVVVSFISCDSGEIESKEQEEDLKAKGMVDDIAYKDFRLGQDGDKHRYDSGLPNTDCTNEDGTCAPDDIVIVIDRKKEMYLQLIDQPLNYRDIFIGNKDLLLEDIHPVLVNGVIDGFF